MGVVQAGDGPCFSLEPFPQVSTVGEMLGQDLEGDFAVQAAVFCQVDFALAASA